MVDKADIIAPAEKIIPALVNHYSSPALSSDAIGRAELVSLLNRLPTFSSDEHVDTITVQIGRYSPATKLDQQTHAQISFVDDATTDFLGQTDLDFRFESFVRGIAPHIAALVLEGDINTATKPNVYFTLIDLLVSHCIGWSEDLGILGEQFMEKIDAIMSPFRSGKTSVNACIDELKNLFDKEDPVFKTMEQRLLDREMKFLSGKKAEFFATTVLNREMANQKLPLFVIFMFQGPWFEFLQKVYVEFGEKSDEWSDAQKITKGMIWTLQPGVDAEKRDAMIKSLPQRIKGICDKASFDTGQMLASIADIEGEWEAIQAGEPSDPCDFDLLDTDQGVASAMQETTSEAAKRIAKIGLDQWFLYDDPKEPDEKVARIKLILNWEETEQLLLTNHNRRKVVPFSYGEMITHLDAGVLRQLNPRHSAAESFKQRLRTVLHSVSDQNKKEKQIETREDREAASEEYSEQRKEALQTQLREIEEAAERKKQRALVLRQKAQRKQEAAEAAINGLRLDAWVKLPIMEGTLTPCKLVAIIASTDTYIFANRAGLKVGEYTASQLAHMLISENSEILDTGVEFESALATVVTGLREDKNKSYAELTGDND